VLFPWPFLREGDARGSNGNRVEGIRGGDVDFRRERDADGAVGRSHGGGFRLANQGDICGGCLAGGDLHSGNAGDGGVGDARGEIDRAGERNYDVGARGTGKCNERQAVSLDQSWHGARGGIDRAGNVASG